MLLRLLGAALLAGCLAACGPSGAAPPPPPDGGSPKYTLEVVSGDGVVLHFGETRDFVVAVRDEHGVPAPGVEVIFVVIGSSHDSGLSSVSATTGENGHARTQIHAGYVNALFRIHVSAAGASSIERFFAVSEAGFGTMNVTARYPGQRTLGGFEARLYFEATCEDLRVVERQAPDRAVELPLGSYEASFESLPASSTYAVALDALLPSGLVMATACVDGLTIAKDEVEEFLLDALDVPYDASGVYAVEIDVQPGVAAMSLGTMAEASATALVTAAGGDAGFLLDALEAYLADADLDAAATALAAARDDGTLDQLLLTALGAEGVGPAAALAAANAALRSESAFVRVTGELTIAAPDAPGPRIALAGSGLSIGPNAGALEAVHLGAIDAAIEVSLDVELDANEQNADLDALVLGLSGAELGRAALRAAASGAGKPSVAAWLGELGGCEVVVESEALDPVRDECDDACLEAACHEAMEALVDAMESAFAASSFARIEAEGALALLDDDYDLVPETIGSAMAFELVPSGSGPRTAVSGALRGARIDAAAP